MFYFSDNTSGRVLDVRDEEARVAFAFADHTFQGGLVRLAINLYALARLAEDSRSMSAHSFALRNCARDLSIALTLMPRLAHGADKLAPLVEAVFNDPVERADNLILQLAAPWLATADE